MALGCKHGTHVNKNSAEKRRLHALCYPLVQPSSLEVLIVNHAEEEAADEADRGHDAPIDHLVSDPRLPFELGRRCRRGRLAAPPRDALRVARAHLG